MIRTQAARRFVAVVGAFNVLAGSIYFIVGFTALSAAAFDAVYGGLLTGCLLHLRRAQP